MNRLLYFLAAVFILSSCSSGLVLSKRQHRGGYHIEWVSNKNEISFNKEDTSFVVPEGKEGDKINSIHNVEISESVSRPVFLDSTELITKKEAVYCSVEEHKVKEASSQVGFNSTPTKKQFKKHAPKKGDLLTMLGGRKIWLYFYFGFAFILWYALKYLKDWNPSLWKKLLYYILFGAVQAVFWVAPVLAIVYAFSVGFTAWVVVTGVCILLSIWLMRWVNKAIKKKVKNVIKGVLNF